MMKPNTEDNVTCNCTKTWLLPLGIIFISAIVLLGYDSTSKSYIQDGAVFHVLPHRQSQQLSEIKGRKTHQIYVESPGRLLNCLFSLAATYRIAQINNRTLVLSPQYINKIKNFLDVNYLPFNIANTPKGVEVVQKASHTKYNAKIENLKDKDLIVGDVQVMRYFLPFESDIRNMFVMKKELEISTQKLLHSFAVNSIFIGIHIRRGDRAAKNRLAVGQVIPRANYLEKAMAYVLSNYSKVQFVVCSDDIQWSKQNVKNGSGYNVYFSAGKSAEWDMALLAQCNHSIMTVGTFGWWGAWLAGGETIYFNHPAREGSPYYRRFSNKDFFWPTWIGMDDT